MSLTRNSKTDNCKGLTKQRERNKTTAAPSETTHRGLSHLHLKTRSRGLLPERLSNLKSSNLKSHSSSFHRVMVRTIPIARHSRKEMAHPHANTSCYRRLPHQRCSPLTIISADASQKAGTRGLMVTGRRQHEGTKK